MRGVGGVRKSIHHSWLAKGLGLGLLCWGFKGVQEEILSGEASTLQIESVAFPPGQCTSPQLHPCHRLSPRWASRQFLGLPTVQTLLPVTFAYSLSSQAVVMRQLRRWKRLWRRSTVQQVHCSRRRLLQRGLEFHVCTINKSLETYLIILVELYVNRCIWKLSIFDRNS